MVDIRAPPPLLTYIGRDINDIRYEKDLYNTTIKEEDERAEARHVYIETRISTKIQAPLIVC